MRTITAVQSPQKRWLNDFVHSGQFSQTIRARDARTFAIKARRYQRFLGRRWKELTWPQKLACVCSILQVGDEVTATYEPYLSEECPTPSDLVMAVDRRMK